MENPDLIEFYGEECPHCKRMKRTIVEFEKKTGIVITKLEVWHNEENMKLLEGIDAFAHCGGVPFLFNRISGKFVCGETTLDELERWAA